MTKVISSNRLSDGLVVFLAEDGSWREGIEAAKTFPSAAEAGAGLAAAKQDVARNLVVDPFIVEIAADGGRRRAASLRDEIRARGPTVDYIPRTDCGASAAGRS